jgi:hypothetical protein
MVAEGDALGQQYNTPDSVCVAIRNIGVYSHILMLLVCYIPVHILENFEFGNDTALNNL